MTPTAVTFLSHTARPGGAELALRRYLLRATVPVRLVTMEPGEVWEGLPCPVEIAPSLPAAGRALRQGDGPVVANSMRAALVGALVTPRRRALVYWVRDGLVDSAMSPLALGLTRHVTARRVSRYIANSVWTSGTVADGLRVDVDRIEVVPSVCGVEGEGTPRPAPRRPVRLLFLGRISPWKAPDVSVRALAAVRSLGLEATLTIAGDAHFGEAAYRAQLEDLVRAEPSATYVGHVRDVQSLLREHDLLVHCSTVPEPFGQVIVQGLSAGLPVVATPEGGPGEILDGAPVRPFYRPGDVDALASRIAENVTRYGEVSAWASARAGRFSDTRTVAATDAVLRRLLTQVAS